MNQVRHKYTQIKPDRPLDQLLNFASVGCRTDLNQHELTNQYRRLAEEVGKPACVEQQTNQEWLAAFDAAEVFS